MTTMYDAVTASNIPKDADVVAGYVNGKYTWSEADWDRFPDATKVHIQIYIPGQPVSTAGHVLDIEANDATSAAAQAAAVTWVKARTAAGGSPPVIYTSRSTRAPIEAALKKEGLTAQWWIADYTGKPHSVPGAVATQWAAGKGYDRSTVKPSWLEQLRGGRSKGGGSSPSQQTSGKPGAIRSAWRLPRNTTGKGGKIIIDTGHLLQLSRNLTGHLAAVESVRRHAHAAEADVAKLRLTDQDQLRRIRRDLATAVSDDVGVGRARWLLLRDLGYVVEARERALGADRTDAQKAHVLESLVATVGGGTTKAGRRKLQRLVAGLRSPRGAKGGSPGGGSKGPGGTKPSKTSGIRDLDKVSKGKAWGGSMAPFTQFITPFLAKRGIRPGSAKRPTQGTATGGVSDHWTGKKDAFATDYPTTDGEASARELARALGIKGWKPGSYQSYNVKIGGRTFRTQILWAVPGHFDHIHVGLQRV